MHTHLHYVHIWYNNNNDDNDDNKKNKNKAPTTAPPLGGFHGGKQLHKHVGKHWLSRGEIHMVFIKLTGAFYVGLLHGLLGVAGMMIITYYY